MRGGQTGHLPPGRLTAVELALATKLRKQLHADLASPTATGVMLLDGRLLIVNAALIQLVGYSRVELIGVDAALLVRREDQASVRRHRLSEQQDEEVLGEIGLHMYAEDVTLVHRSGWTVAVRETSLLLHSVGEAPVAFVVRWLRSAQALSSSSIPAD